MGHRRRFRFATAGLALGVGGTLALLAIQARRTPEPSPDPGDVASAARAQDAGPELSGLSEEALRARRTRSAARWRELLTAEDPAVRRASVADWARSGLEPAAAAEVLVPFLTDADPEMRRTVRHALRAIGDPAVDVLLRVGRSADDWELPALTIEVLGLIAIADGGGSAPPALLAILGDGTQHRVWRARAAIALGHVRPVDPRVPAALKQAMRERDQEVAAGALEGLGALGAEVEDLIPTLLAMLEDPDQADLQPEAARALGQIARRADVVFPALERWGTPRRGDTFAATAIARFGKAAFPWLEGALRDEDDRRQYFALGVLDEMGPAGAPLAPRLIRLADEAGEWGLVWRVKNTVAAMGPAAHAVVPDIVRIVLRAEEARHIAHAWLEMLPALGPDGEAALLGLLDSGGSAVRGSACWQLAVQCARSPETRPRIQRLADEDRDESVRNQALWALRKLDAR